ncbi:hypothetical protein HAX54_051285, partial [Datura stramonium]|nr:hypothetical protein [Datura stramonium]
TSGSSLGGRLAILAIPRPFKRQFRDKWYQSIAHGKPRRGRSFIPRRQTVAMSPKRSPSQSVRDKSRGRDPSLHRPRRTYPRGTGLFGPRTA